MKMILSVIFFFVFCFPIWWYSTSVYQKELPHEEILAFKTQKKNLPLELRIFSNQQGCNILQNIKKSFGKYEFNRKCSEIQPKEEEILLKKMKEKKFEQSSNERGIYDLYILKSNEKKILISTERSIYSTVDSMNQGKFYLFFFNSSRQFGGFIT